MNKRNLLLTLIIFSSTLCVAQWTTLGLPVIGQVANDKLGDYNAIALDAAGTTLAVGSSRNSELGIYFGYAKVFDWDGDAWVQRGDTFHGSADFEGTGEAVALSGDGNTLVVSSPWGYNSLGYKCGVVRVFDWDGDAWVQRGPTVEGEGSEFPVFERDVFGMGVSISPDGNFLAVGAPNNTQEPGGLEFNGHVRVYRWEGGLWQQMGQDIDGELALEDFGRTLDISADGTLLAAGGRSFRLLDQDSIIANEVGIVRTYLWSEGEWILRSPHFVGSASGEQLGSSVRLSHDGQTMAFSAKGGTDRAFTRVFDWSGSAWVQRGSDLPGVNESVTRPSCDLSADGNILVVGESWANTANGIAKVFQWNGGSWALVDNILQGTGSTSEINGFGTSVSLSADGSRLAVGAPSHSTNANADGRVYVFANQSLVDVEDLASTVDVAVYPNPTADILHINAPIPIERALLLDALGRTVATSATPALTHTMDVSALPAGAYFLSLFGKQDIQTIKVIVY